MYGCFVSLNSVYNDSFRRTEIILSGKEGWRWKLKSLILNLKEDCVLKTWIIWIIHIYILIVCIIYFNVLVIFVHVKKNPIFLGLKLMHLLHHRFFFCNAELSVRFYLFIHCFEFDLICMGSHEVQLLLVLVDCWCATLSLFWISYYMGILMMKQKIVILLASNKILK
jgi:hypothetical protein